MHVDVTGYSLKLRAILDVLLRSSSVAGSKACLHMAICCVRPWKRRGKDREHRNTRLGHSEQHDGGNRKAFGLGWWPGTRREQRQALYGSQAILVWSMAISI